jgi:tetratricopeptide (TPR) repeat protein
MEMIRLFFEKIENKMHTLFALGVGFIILFSGFIVSDNFLSKYLPPIFLKWFYLFSLVIWLFFWLFHKFYIKKCKKDEVGIVLCIYADSNDAEQTLKMDFINTVKKQISDINVNTKFNTNVIKNHQSELFNNIKGIENLHNKTRGHFYIFGDVKKRNNEFYLSLSGLVLHRPIPIIDSNEIAKDFNAVLPKSINFREELSFKEFSTSAEQTVATVKYIVGLAAFVSGDPELAIQLHEDLKIYIQDRNIKTASFIKSKLNTYLANEYALLSQFHFINNNQIDLVKCLEKASTLDSNNYRVLIMQSMIAFSVENDPQKALLLTKKCSSFNAPQWRYNEAFLYFWLGKYDEAIKSCEKLRQQNYPNEFLVSKEVTSFNEQILSSKKISVLYYWLGWNYWYKQNNITLALNNFEEFEKLTTNETISLKQRSTPLLEEIRKEMGIKK